MPTNWMPLAPRAACAATNCGISSRQGAHQVAQKLTTRTLPRHCASAWSWPSGSGSTTSSSAAPSRCAVLVEWNTAAPAASAASPATAPPTRIVRRFIGSVEPFPGLGGLDVIAGLRTRRRYDDFHVLRIGGIAHAHVGATLGIRVHRQSLAGLPGAREGHAHDERVPIGLDIAEEGVVLHLARGQVDAPRRHRRDAKRQAVTVKVI